MKIARLNSSDESKFEELALNYGTIFNSMQWSRLFYGNVTHYGIYDKGDNLVGGFMTYRESKFGLSVFRNPPFTPEVGPFLKINASNPVSIMDTWKNVLHLLCDLLEDLPYSIICFELSKSTLDMQPFIWSKFKVVPGYTYVIDLSVEESRLWTSMSNERRKNINKAIKDHLAVIKVDNYDLIRNLVLKTYSRQGKKIDEIYLNKILFDFANDRNSFAYAAYQNNMAIACTFCIYDSTCAYYLLGGYDDTNKHNGAGAICMWEAINYARKLDLKYFDFEGSMNKNIERYFRGFGGQLTPYYRIIKASLPLEILMKFWRRDLF